MTRTIGYLAILILAASLFGACSPATGTSGSPPPAPSGGAVITAQGNAFDRQQLEVPAGRPFPLLFENRESAPHNVTIFDEGVDQPLFAGEVFGGPASRTYDVPGIPVGSYRFRCDVHPEMAGTVTAR